MFAIFAMHMADALVSAKVGLAMSAAMLAVLAFCARKTADCLDARSIPFAGVMGAFVFAAQMMNFLIPMTGSSGHISGGILLAAVLGAYPAFLALSCVLVIQALFFADGGILALGCNIFNMAFIPCLAVYPLVFLPIARRAGTTAAAVAACTVSAVLGALGVSAETLCSGVSELSFGTFAALMVSVHIAIGLAEGVITAFAASLLKDARPELLGAAADKKTLPSKGALCGFLALATFATCAGFSLLASNKPDGLEWSLERSAGGEVSAPATPQHSASAAIAEKTAFFPDYSLSGDESAAGRSASGVAGGIITVAAICAAACGLKLFRRKCKAA